MLNPAIGKLIKNNDNRYRLVVEISRKARDIAAKAEENSDQSIDKPLSEAINSIAKEQGLI